MKLLVVMGALAAMMCACGRGESAKEAELQPAGLENVAVGGELAERISRNFDRMESPLYQPEQLFWSEEESGGWPADKEGRTILALVMDARASGRQPVYLDTIMAMLPQHLNERGYMGTIHQDVDEQQLSGHGWLLRGLCEYHEWTGDTAALDIAKGIAHNLFVPITGRVADYPITVDKRIGGVGDMSGSTQNTVDGWRLSSDIGCVFIGMEGLIHYYKFDRDPAIRKLIDALIQRFLQIDLIGIKAQTHASLTALRGIMRYMDITGDRSLLPAVRERWACYRNHGMTENFENFNWFDRCDTWTEPCAVVDSYMVAVQLWQATRDPRYLADAEQIYYNGLCVSQRANGGFGCDKPVGPEFDDISIHADEAHWCCTMRGGEGLGRVAESSYYVAADTVFVPFYREGALSLPEFRLVQHTGYPFGDEVAVTVDSASTRDMVLALPAPEYLKSVEVSVNGTAVEPERAGGFMFMPERVGAGDEIRIKYELSAEWVAVNHGRGVKAMYGPLVMAAQGKGGQTEATLFTLSHAGGVPVLVINESGDTLTPLYHHMSPSVALDSAYCRTVLFRQ